MVGQKPVDLRYFSSLFKILWKLKLIGLRISVLYSLTCRQLRAGNVPRSVVTRPEQEGISKKGLYIRSNRNVGVDSTLFPCTFPLNLA